MCGMAHKTLYSSEFSIVDSVFSISTLFDNFHSLKMSTSHHPISVTPSPTDRNALIERVHLPRIAIKFCTQCRWMLRAAYVCMLPSPISSRRYSKREIHLNSSTSSYTPYHFSTSFIFLIPLASCKLLHICVISYCIVEYPLSAST